MIFELIFNDKRVFAQAKSQLHLLQEWNKEYDDFNEILEVVEISEEKAETIMLRDTEYDEDKPESDDNVEMFSLLDMICGDDFVVVGSTEWD